MSRLTKSEITILLRSLTRHQALTHHNYEAVMSWATAARLDSDLLELVLLEYLDITVDRSGVLQFIPSAKGLASERRQELERMPV
jgi:hypothetical protein